MNLTRLMIWKEFAHIKADKFSLRLMIFPVFGMLFILGYALTTEVKNIDIAVVDLSLTPQSRSLAETIHGNNLFRWKQPAATVDEARRRIDNGAIKAALVIPADFARALATSEGASVQLLVDGQDANSCLLYTSDAADE